MRGGALGDFILGLPALRALREAFPSACLELVAPGAVLSLASRLVDVATPIERAEMAAFFGEAELPRDLAERYADLDLAVVWLADTEGLVRRHFERLGARRILHAPALPPKGARLHAADYLLQALTGSEGILPALGEPEVRPNPAAVESARALMERLGLTPENPIVAIHPGSGGRWKCWPAERFAQAIDLLKGASHQVALIQGLADEEVVANVLASLKGERPPVLSSLPVEELAAFLSLCGCYLGNDSGVTHLAAAVGAPAVALFGPTDPDVWGPRGRAVTILQGDQGRLEAITVEQVVEAVSGFQETQRES